MPKKPEEPTKILEAVKDQERQSARLAAKILLGCLEFGLPAKYNQNSVERQKGR